MKTGEVSAMWASGHTDRPNVYQRRSPLHHIARAASIEREHTFRSYSCWLMTSGAIQYGEPIVVRRLSTVRCKVADTPKSADGCNGRTNERQKEMNPLLFLRLPYHDSRNRQGGGRGAERTKVTSYSASETPDRSSRGQPG